LSTTKQQNIENTETLNRALLPCTHEFIKKRAFGFATMLRSLDLSS